MDLIGAQDRLGYVGRRRADVVGLLAVKDRLLGHNPLAAIHTMDSYYRSLKPAP